MTSLILNIVKKDKEFERMRKGKKSGSLVESMHTIRTMDLIVQW